MKKGKPKAARWTNRLRSGLCLALVLVLSLGNIVAPNAAKAADESTQTGGTEAVAAATASEDMRVYEATVPVEPEEEEKTASAPDLLSVDFNGEWAEFGPSVGLGETNSKPERYELVTDSTDATNKYLKVTHSGSTVNLNKFFTSVKDQTAGKEIVYEYSLSADDVAAMSGNVKLFAASGGTSYFRLRSGGTLWYNAAGESGQELGNIVAGEWTKIAMVVDYASSTDDGATYKYKLYINNVCVKDYDDTPTGIGATAKTPLGPRVEGAGHILIDNLRIYEGSEPAAPYDSSESDQYTPDYINVDFDGEWSEFGSVFGLEAATAKIFQVTDPADAENKYLKLVLAEDGGSHTDLRYGVDGVANKQIVYEYKVSYEADGNPVGKAKLFMAVDATGYFYLRPNGAIKVNNGDTLATITPGTWTKISMVVDYSTSPYTHKIYIDDVCVKDDGKCSGETFMKLRLDKEIPGGHIIIDDLRVYEGTEPHVPGTGVPVGSNIYVDRTFNEIWKYDFEEIEVTRNKSSVAVVEGTDATGSAGKYVKLAAADAAEPATITYITDKASGYIVAQAKLSLESVAGNAGSVFTGVGADGKEFSFLNIKDDSVQLPDGTEVAKLTAGTWIDIAVAVDTTKQTYTVYVGGEVVSGAKALAVVDVAGLASIYTAVSAGVLLIDDLRVYDAKVPQMTWNVDDNPDTIYVKDSEAQELIGTAKAIQLNANTLYADGVKYDATKAFDTSEGGKVYLAEADIKTLFGADVNLSGLTAKDGAYDVYAVAAANGYTYVHEMEGRMILFDTKEITLEGTNEKEVNKYLQFERPSVDEIKELFSKNVDANDGHPRVLVTQDDVDRIKALYDSGETYIKLWGDNAIAKAEAALTTADFDFNYKPGDSMDHVDEALPMIINLGMAYFLTEDAEAKAAYVAKAKSIANIICNLKDWNPLSYLDVGELSFILGIAYDWFYDEFTEEEKAIIEKNLMEKGVGIQNKIYYGKVNSDEVYWTWWDNTNNWNFVCNGGAICGAIALFDVYPDICAQVISNTMHGLEFMMESYFPEGVWHEGGGYWRYALNYVAYTMTTMDNVFADDFGFLCSPGLDQTGWYGLKLSGSTGINNFGDAGTAFIDCKSVLWCADMYDDKELLAARLQEMELQGYTGDGRDIIFYDASLLDGMTVELPLDTVLDSMSVVSLRERWYDKGATFLGFSGSKTKSGHAHMDFGSFVVDMLGERVIGDIGADDYNADGYFSTKRYWYYRTRPEGHNLYIINPTDDKADYGGYTPWVEATNTPVVAKDRGAFSTLDLSNVYAEDTNSAIRGFMLTDDRRNVIVRDEIDLKGASEIYSYLHTKASVVIDEEDPNVAILTLNGTKYKVIIDVQGEAIESYSLSVVAAESRADYGVKDGNNAAWCKLQIYVKTSDAGMVNITMKVVGYDDPAADVALITTPIAEWSADMIPDGEAPELPYVDMIYLNGEPISNFDSAVTGYAGRLGAAAKLPVVTATSEIYERIEIISATDFGEDYVVKVYDNEDENLYRVYRLNYTRLPELKPVDGRERYSVANITASATPEEAIGNTRENAIDNDFELSRWTADCKRDGESHWLMLELDELNPVHKIGFSFYNGHKRATIFIIEVSEDGENWTKVFDGRSSAKTSGLEYFFESEEGIMAKYVRFTGWGNTSNEWNNITEFVVLGPKNSAVENYTLGENTAVDILHNNTSANLVNKKVDDETTIIEGVLVDGVVLDMADFTVLDENIGKVTLSAEYMESLTAGEHVATLAYQDGTSIDVILNVVEPTVIEIVTDETTESYLVESGDAVTVQATGLSADLIGVMVNGDLVDFANYVIADEETTIVTFKNEYLDTLAAGSYKVTLLYSNGRSAETVLLITVPAVDPGPGVESPDTGDFGPGVWMWLAAAAVMACGYAVIRESEKKRQK